MYHKHLKKPGKTERERGFTVLEIIIVVAVVGILTVVAIVRFISTQDEKAKSAAQQMVSDVAYAQQMARSNNKGTVVGINGGGGGGGGGGGCFVATVCYGERSQQVTALRGFRDQVLQKSRPGRVFVRWYYRDGPALAQVVKQSPVLRTTVKALILPLAMMSAPFASDAFAFGGGGGGDGGGGGGGIPSDPNTYTISYKDGTWIKNPLTGENFYVDMDDAVSITSSDFTLNFDSSGKLTTPDYSWGNMQTSTIICTLNDVANVRIARHTGKTWVE